MMDERRAVLTSRKVRRLRRTVIGPAIGLAAALTVAACGSGSSSTPASGGSSSPTSSSSAATAGAGTGNLTIAAEAGPISLDPTLSSNGIPQIWFPNLAYAPLIQRAKNGQATPGLATSWGFSKNLLAFHLNLRSGVTFSDGTPLTAADVVQWLERYKAKGSLTEYLLNVTKIAATGPMQVTLTLSSPNPLIPYGLDQDGMAGDVVGSKGLADPSILGSSTDGAGPYMLDKTATIAESQYVYVKNPYYYDKSAQHYGKITIKVISDGNSVLSAMQDGQVQVAEGAATNAPSAKSDGFDIEVAPSALVGVYLADQDGKLVPALGNEKVRQALSYAVNRAGITKSLYGQYATPTDQGVPADISGNVAGLESAFPYDPSKAKQLLAQAGYPHGFSFTLVEQPAVDSGDLLAQALVQDWKAIGVNVTIKTTPSFSAYVTLLLSKKYPATTFTFQYSTQLTETLELIADTAAYNWLQYKQPEAEAVGIKELMYEIGSPQGAKAAQAAESYMTENGSIIGVSSTDAVLFSKGVSGVQFASYPWPDPAEWVPAS
jgi:peptide/nickel transport system substrate-binding protein